MKIVTFVGSGRKKNTYNACVEFIENLGQLSNQEVESEVIMLGDYNIKTCTGCLLCLDKGEELCPLKDDRDLLLEKINNADGVVFATPNYSFQVSGMMKVFLDRLGFIFHRPRFFDKVCTSIVTQGIYGGGKIIKYFDFIGNALGFQRVKGSCLTTIQPASDKQIADNKRKLMKHAERFYKQITSKKPQKASLFELMIFRASRSKLKAMEGQDFRDIGYYRDMGWFESDFYYPVKMNPVKKMFGKLFDRLF